MRRFMMVGAVGCIAVLGVLSCTEHGPTEVQSLSDGAIALSPAVLVPGETTAVTMLLPDAESPSDGAMALRWLSSDPSVVSVVDDTLLVSRAEGTAQITAQSSPSRTSSTTVQVLPDTTVTVKSILVLLNSSSIGVSDTTRAVAVLLDPLGNRLLGRAVTWSSSNTTVATINSAGKIRGQGAGLAQIVARRRGLRGSAPLTVMVGGVTPAAVASVTVSLAQGALQVGDSTTATAVVRDSAGNVLADRSVAWTSDNPAVAVVSSAGVVRSLAAGTARIIGTAGSISGNAALTVSAPAPAPTPAPAPVPVSSVTVSLNASALTVGQSTQASAVVRDSAGTVLTGRTIVWSSDNAAIATVSATGLVTAVAQGTAHIVATSEGKSGAATLDVGAPPPVPVASVTVALNATTVTVGQSTQATATVRDSANQPLTGRTIAWSSSNTAVATVSATGLVTAVATGSAPLLSAA